MWLEDPEFEQIKTDIACVVVSHPNAENIFCMNDNQDEAILSNVGIDCFVVGYPNPNYEKPCAPIWRRGVVAQEPMIAIDSKPIFLVDATTSSGMSGSPIIQRWHGPVAIRTNNGSIETKIDAVVTSRFIGVYGGRLSVNSQMGDVGYGWYANRIEMIINGISNFVPEWNIAGA